MTHTRGHTLTGGWQGTHDYAVLYLDKEQSALRYWSLRRGMALPEGRIQVAFLAGNPIMEFLKGHKLYVLEHSLPVLQHPPYMERPEDATAPVKERVKRGLGVRLAAAHITAAVSDPYRDQGTLGEAKAKPLIDQFRALLRKSMPTAHRAAAVTQASAASPASGTGAASVQEKSPGADRRVEPRGGWQGTHDYAVLYLDKEQSALRYWSLRRGMALPEGRIQVAFLAGNPIMQFLKGHKLYVLEHSLPVLQHPPYMERPEDATAPVKERVKRGLGLRLAAAHITAAVSDPYRDQGKLGEAKAKPLMDQFRALLRKSMPTAHRAAAATQASAASPASGTGAASVQEKSPGADRRVEPRGEDADSPSLGEDSAVVPVSLGVLPQRQVPPAVVIPAPSAATHPPAATVTRKRPCMREAPTAGSTSAELTAPFVVATGDSAPSWPCNSCVVSSSSHGALVSTPTAPLTASTAQPSSAAVIDLTHTSPRSASAVPVEVPVASSVFGGGVDACLEHLPTCQRRRVRARVEPANITDSSQTAMALSASADPPDSAAASCRLLAPVCRLDRDAAPMDVSMSSLHGQFAEIPGRRRCYL